MAVKKMVAGKRQLTVRINDEDYKLMQVVAAYDNMTVNEWIVEVSTKMAREINAANKRYVM